MLNGSEFLKKTLHGFNEGILSVYPSLKKKTPMRPVVTGLTYENLQKA